MTAWKVLFAYCCVSFLLLTVAHSAEPVLLRMKADAGDRLLVGQRFVITVDLLTKTTFASAPAFDLPTIPGAVFMKLNDRPVVGNETIEQDTYTLQTHELWFFALHSGEFTIPQFAVRFASPKDFGQPPVDFQLSSKPVSVVARMPPEAKGLPTLLCATDFRVTEHWQPQPRPEFRVGDSLTRTLTLSASNVPAMVFPIVPQPQIVGLKAYLYSPVVNDRLERGDLYGKRVDSVTYVCEQAGDYSLPELVFPWWNTDTGRLEKVRLPAVTLRVVPSQKPSVVASASPPGPASATLGWSWAVALAGALLLASGWYYRTSFRDHWKQLIQRRRDSEAGRFADLLQACRLNNPRDSVQRLYRWLDACDSSPTGISVAEDLVCDNTPGWRQQIELLESSAVGLQPGWSGTDLIRLLHAVRDHRHFSIRSQTAAIPPLNPG
ncbi:MAG: hypothetical protein V4719_12790 [Planctomycetota bacterium]